MPAFGATAAKRTNKPFVSYCAEWNMFVYANQTKAPKFCSHKMFLGGTRCLKTGDKLKNDIKADREFMRSLYSDENPYVPTSQQYQQVCQMDGSQ
mmetsp:Transcript_18638/g.29596  ORF Transcript_18638/g.29596 Transcript_18638/m.29596 type:complete len:95 (-) Transcript_18638:514-798(-)